MRLLGRTQPLDRYSILECLSVVKRLGFDGAEICLENPDLRAGLLDDGLVGRVRERVAKLDLAPCSISLHVDYVYDDALLEESLEAIRRTPEFGTDLFVFSGAPRRTGDAAEWQRMVDRTRRLVDAAEARGVTLAKEFEPGFAVGSTSELLRLFAEIPSPHLAANLDLGHAFLCDPDPIQAIHDLGAKIVHVHVENMRAGVHDHLLPQEGDMDLQLYVDALAGVGFAGGMALDLYKYDYEQVAPETIRYIRGLYSQEQA